MIKAVFFASIRETIGVGQIEMALSDANTVADVVAMLVQRGDQWRTALAAENLLMAVNQTMVPPSHPVADGDEVAFFPPVTGG